MKIFIIILAVILFLACIIGCYFLNKYYNNIFSGIFPNIHVSLKNIRNTDIFFSLTIILIFLSILTFFYLIHDTFF